MDRVIRPVELAVVDIAVTASSTVPAEYQPADQTAYQKPRDTGITVGDNECIRPAIGVADAVCPRGPSGSEIQTAESGKPKADVECRDGIDAHWPHSPCVRLW